MGPLNQKGMFLETILNLTHAKYNEQSICLVYKIPVQQGWDQKHEKHYFAKHHACDYIGNYQGQYFEFEAKETNFNYFNWNQIRISQHLKLQQVSTTKGKSFLIIYFGLTNQFFYIPYQELKNYVENHQKKIPLHWFQEKQIELIIDQEIKLDYLPFLKK